MLKISYEIGGRKVSPNHVTDAIMGAVLKGIEDIVKKKVGSVRCPKHGQAPTIAVKGATLNKLSFDIHGCCEGLTEAVRKKLGS
jgi:hypothetical protein